MKKLTFMAAMAIAAASLTSCGGSSAPSANLKTDIDSVSYAVGVSMGNNFNVANVINQLEVDSAYIDEFIKGVLDRVNAGDDKKTQAYYAGVQIGFELAEQVLPGMQQQLLAGDTVNKISKADFLSAFLNMLSGKETAMTAEAADSLSRAFREKAMQKQMEAQFADYKKQNEDYLVESQKNDSVKTTPSGLQYKVITEGKGELPTDTSTVKVEYEGRLIDGTVFDASKNHGDKPAEFPVNGVIKGWTEALKMMPVGSEWEVIIPQNLAYGVQGSAPTIKPFSTLIFRMKLVDIVK